MRGGQDRLDKGWYRLVDGLTAALLALELWSILSGLPRFIRYWQSETFHSTCWTSLVSASLMVVLTLGMPLIAILFICNIWMLYRKAQLPRRYLYRCSNATALQVLFLLLTLFCYHNLIYFSSY